MPSQTNASLSDLIANTDAIVMAMSLETVKELAKLTAPEWRRLVIYRRAVRAGFFSDEVN